MMNSIDATRPWDYVEKDFVAEKMHHKYPTRDYGWLMQALPVWPEEATTAEIARKLRKRPEEVRRALSNCSDPRLAEGDNNKFCLVIW